MSAQKGGGANGRKLTALYNFGAKSYDASNFAKETKDVQNFCIEKMKTKDAANKLKEDIKTAIKNTPDSKIQETLTFVEYMLGINGLVVEKNGSYSRTMGIVSKANFYVVYGKKSQRIVTDTNWYDVIAITLAGGLESLKDPQKDDIKAHTINTSAFINHFKGDITKDAKTEINSKIDDYCKVNGKYKNLDPATKEQIKKLFDVDADNFNSALDIAINGINGNGQDEQPNSSGGTRRRKRGGKKSKAKKTSKNKTNKKRKRKGSKKSRK